MVGLWLGGCDDLDDADAGVPDGGSGCPNLVEVDEVVNVPSPNPDRSALMWAVKGFGMRAEPGGHNGMEIAETLRNIEDEGILRDDFDPIGVEVCPFASGDAQRLFTCGAEESTFIVGRSKPFSVLGQEVARFPARIDIFWDTIATVADGSVLGRLNNGRANDGLSPISRCRLGCIQTYHCERQSNDALSLFYRIEDFVLDQPTNATLVVLQTVDEDGRSF